jgi:hypothetical protein
LTQPAAGLGTGLPSLHGACSLKASHFVILDEVYEHLNALIACSSFPIIAGQPNILMYCAQHCSVQQQQLHTAMGV